MAIGNAPSEIAKLVIKIGLKRALRLQESLLVLVYLVLEVG
jgi:hypothetical protein